MSHILQWELMNKFRRRKSISGSPSRRSCLGKNNEIRDYTKQLFRRGDTCSLLLLNIVLGQIAVVVPWRGPASGPVHGAGRP